MLENSRFTPEQFVPDIDTAAVWTIRYLDPSGFECQLSLEASSGSDVLKKARGAVEYLKETQCSPILRVPTIPLSKVNDNDEVHRCLLHNVPMKRWEKNGKIWHAHKFEDHWCRGKG